MNDLRGMNSGKMQLFPRVSYTFSAPYQLNVYSSLFNYLFAILQGEYGENVEDIAPTVPKSGTVGAKTAPNAPTVPETGTVGALKRREV